MTEEVIVIAKWDYTAQQDQELDIKKNERLWLLDDSKTWWRVRNAANRTGYVPSNYVERKNSLKKGSLVKNLKDTLGLGKTKRKTSARDASPTPSTDAEFPANGGGADRIYDLNIPAFVKFAYVAEREDELSLVKGSRVTVMEKCSDGWWRGSYNGQIGWFPSNYVLEEMDEAAAESPRFLSLRKGASLSNGQGARVLHVVQTLYPFSSVTEEELNFEKGETMEVIEKPENDPEWWKCKNARGQVGLVPKNYVVVLSDGPALHPAHAPQISYAGPACSGRFAGREWYYGNVTRHQAECALNERGVEGDFLIRDSESSPSDFSVSLKASGKNKHFKVQLVDNVYCIGQRRFHTMDELVEHYKKAPIFTSEHGEKLYLVRALQ
ncbi:cytoplasmic protein NCK2 isoform 1-T3 [Lycaon pictus]|uniref:Cytoplasmic protein n=3 Tax=Canis lupus TaxID=9612 RepID=A0A8C0P465_CANLF|nr:cytoplasmic protein NCK2 [Canis lupus familiaris]XP_005626042.1 cytoplasmic protein NCK2 [Canis lupus familiaris]XP_005626043.1 cytoplasmic protein NCK2 [Canis lupus familiaris]XP_025318730.1 cytoplasmic protein NCK2 [Canis lupus dingo]XP_025318736.1 cytoplasmic protein NCK2 [Canis lupus dingo]XP_025318748.1 cytoplasmic protein NCK2 [Canis lupus dingo]XP_025318765.1 cytoplasmic protein NCK2 [Canis lupus dingo]XP_038406809.1 cytoplasmic protein NCK2 [Canis lupus familiaris]XP_038406810.1 |eukprot:XP_005626041.1 cytoplasmic protein NCK2 [Canis lupus familiaris]